MIHRHYIKKGHGSMRSSVWYCNVYHLPSDIRRELTPVCKAKNMVTLNITFSTFAKRKRSSSLKVRDIKDG